MSRSWNAPPGSFISLETLSDYDIDIDDDGRGEEMMLGVIRHDEILGLLTPEMREVAELLEQGYLQKEIAVIRGTTEVAVWMTAARMRKRLDAHGLRPKPRVR